MDPWSTIGTAASLFSAKDITYSQVLAAKKALEILAKNKETVLPIVQLCLACANNDTYSVKDLITENQSLLNMVDSKGLTPLIYAICFHNNDCVDVLLTLNVDCNEPDNLVGWTPIMWATYLDYEDIIERLVSSNADPKKTVGKSMKNAIQLIKPGSKAEEYYKIHGYLEKPKYIANDSFYATDNTLASGVKNISLNSDNNKFIDETNDYYDEMSTSDEFNFNMVQYKQYLKFNDNSIRAIMDYLFDLPNKYHTKPLYPSSVIFQCLRYAEDKLNNPGMVKMLMDLYIIRIRNVSGTKSGVVQFYGEKERKEREKQKKKEKDTTPDPPPVDITTICYWISALNHLYYYLVRDTACNFLSKYPELLQDLISCLQSLIFKLAFTLDAKLETILEPCILQYNSVPDTDIIYKSDWKVFKNQSKQHTKSSYEEIIDMLYPPSYKEQMKPSPLKVIQTLGALLYVLELYYVSDVIKQQCLSAVLYFIGAHLFNKIVSHKRYCSRIKALEIRLNISYIQDWLRSNNLQPFIEEDGNFDTVLAMWRNDGFPDTLVGKPTGYLSNVCRYNGDARDPTDATYYMNHLFTIGKYALAPVVELTEWLQVFTEITTLEEMQDTLDVFEVLASSTMVQCVRNYHYEVDEKKFPKKIKKWLKENRHNESDKLQEKGMFYKDESKLVLNQGQAFPLCLPRKVQLLHQYGADFKHVDNRKLAAYQPHIPVIIRDDIETIVDEHADEDEDGHYEGYDNVDNNVLSQGNSSNDSFGVSTGQNKQETNYMKNEWDEDSRDVLDGDTNASNSRAEYGTVCGDAKKSDLFQELSIPTTVAQKTWQDSPEGNPWA